jgi:predicted NodU family carbamoyl transferase
MMSMDPARHGVRVPGLLRPVHLHDLLMRILGLSAYYHDSAASLVVDGRIIAAAQEERFTRRKHDARVPAHAAGFCLERASGELKDKERFFSATAIFDREPAAVYEDDCCHYTLRGNELLADFIAARVLETMSSTRRMAR